MSADWWARKLGGAAAPAVQQSPQQSYPGTPQQQYLLPVPQGGQHPQVTAANIAEVAGLWHGGKATKTETTRCPNCNGDHYFSQSHTNTLAGGAGGAGARIATERGMATTAPRCFDCGFSTARPLQTGSM